MSILYLALAVVTAKNISVVQIDSKIRYPMRKSQNHALLLCYWYMPYFVAVRHVVHNSYVLLLHSQQQFWGYKRPSI